MIKQIYRVARSILFSVTLVVIGLYVILYMLLSIPPFQNYIKNVGLKELSTLLGSEVTAGSLRIAPFNEVVIENLEVLDLQGEKCISIETVGAGISLWKLLTRGEIELTYGEIIGLHAYLVQSEENAPLNIQFILDAFAPKDKNKEKKPFSLALRNVVLRKSSISFQRPWLGNRKLGDLDLSDLRLSNLRADITFPKISDSGVTADLRRLSFRIPDNFSLEKLALKGEFGSDGIFVENFTFETPNSRLYLPRINFPFLEGESLTETLKKEIYDLNVTESYITPSDFSLIFPPLSSLSEQLPLEINAKGNLRNISVEEFSFGNSETLELIFTGNMKAESDFKNLTGSIADLKLSIGQKVIEKILPTLKNLPPKISKAIGESKFLTLNGKMNGGLSPLKLEGDAKIVTQILELDIEGGFEKSAANSFQAFGDVKIDKLQLDHMVNGVPVQDITGHISIDATGGKGIPEGHLDLDINNFKFKGKEYDGLTLILTNNEGDIEGDLLMNNVIGNIGATFEFTTGEEIKNGIATLEIENLNLSELVDMKRYNDFLINANISLEGKGIDINDVEGNFDLNKLSFISPDNSKSLKLNHLEISAGVVDSLRSINIDSDWLQGSLNGKFRFTDITTKIMEMAEGVVPSLLTPKNKQRAAELTDLELQLVVKPNNSLIEFFNMPFRLLVPVVISGNMESESNSASLAIDLPYLQQGRDKLIYDSRAIARLDGNQNELNLVVETTMPVKRGDLSLSLNLSAQEDNVESTLRWQNTENSDFKGTLSLIADILKNEMTLQPEFIVNLKPTVLSMGTADWTLENCLLTYSDKRLQVEGLKIWHDAQYVKIDGIASPEFADVLKIDLADIDVNYIFDMLRINYVTFGGIATGEVSGHGLLGPDMSAETETLRIDDFSYNGAVIGDCQVASKWNNEEKEVEISALITKNGSERVKAHGGVWVTRDSLAFDIAANKVPVEFIQPFMSVFSSHVGGFATGDVSLFGTFKDIDLVGKIFADSVAIKLDYTNTIYHGSDSVFLKPGLIEIPGFRLYDQYGNSALLSGELTHRYFHEPAFTFRLSDAENLLCYDTNSEINPDWYGTLYGTGSAYLSGEPGIVDISADMTISGNSAFTFVLNDTQYAQDYQFLTFSDRRAAAQMAAQQNTQDFKEIFRQMKQQEQGEPSRFAIDIRATVTPTSLFTLVMDPAAGDKITARGRGAMQVKYESDNDEMQMYGKYEIDEGNYNFSLQDIILRDFKIKEGSSISFNGNPLAADLDISATYRVNTNLSDLDKSFSSDRDLARTNVPVDAVLMVKGDMDNPEITFDVELPTLTQDVERKVKSIISTDDMMNRQIIYLLALNRFYTPEYMGSTSNGSELAAVASTTLSSQLSNILGQLTDKVSVSPSFRSDKGDFSDIEVDVALSSRLLNNRLLINGNFGYRDKNNSSTTFVGDFDVEYLLSKNGNLRLKAYNHFNDQNYYLREALTTQGLGVVWRKDFDSFLPMLKRLQKKGKEKTEGEEIINQES